MDEDCDLKQHLLYLNGGDLKFVDGMVQWTMQSWLVQIRVVIIRGQNAGATNTVSYKHGAPTEQGIAVGVI